MTRRYRVTVEVHELDDPDSYINPETGKVEPHVRTIGDDTVENIDPPWVKVAGFGGTADGETLTSALPDLTVVISENFVRVEQYAALADRV
jgi:hypothetical protein